MTNDEIEAVARAICVNLAFDPDESVGTGYGDDHTPIESAAQKDGASHPDIMLYMPRWRLYRRMAAEAIATRDALK